MSFFEKLYQITDATGRISDRVLGYINENFRILEMTLNGRLSANNIQDDSITDNKISSSTIWNDATIAINDSFSDLKLTPIEVNHLGLSLQQLLSESTDLVSTASTLGITTEKTDYSTSITALINLLDPFIDTDYQEVV